MKVKAVVDEVGKARKFTGIASTITPDRMDDIVVPAGAIYKTPFPFLWQHDSKQPIGWVRVVRVSKDQIEVDVEIYDEPTPGKLKDRLDEAWQSIKAGLVAGLSIGFRPKKTADIEGTWGYEILEWDWLELSAVTIPANAEATITRIKSIDTAQMTATGRKSGAADHSLPGDTGSNRNGAPRRTGASTMKTAAQLREELRTKKARQGEIMEAWQKDGASAPTEAEQDEFDVLEGEVKALEQDVRIATFKEREVPSLKGVSGDDAEAGSRSRSPLGFVKRQDPDEKFKGQAMTRLAMAKAAVFIAMKEGHYITAGDWAQKRWGKTHPNLVAWIKAAVPGFGSGSGEPGAELVQSDTRYNGDFVEFIYSLTVFDKLPLRPVPANVHVKGQDGQATGYWVGQSKAIPVTNGSFSDVDLKPLKVGAIAVASKEVIADSDPSIELYIRDMLGEASAQRVDTTFLSAAAASAGVSPAGILNGVSALAPSGADAAAVRNDALSLYSSFLTAKTASGLVQIMTPSMAKAISLMVNALGQTEFPLLKATGGELLGDPVYTGDNVTPGDWILLRPKDIWKIGDSGIEISMSDSAMVEQDTAPTGATDTPSAATANMVSLWQEDSIGFKVTRRINYQIRRPGAVALLSNAEYGGVIS
jgi:HK97 family phage prohead protease